MMLFNGEITNTMILVLVHDTSCITSENPINIVLLREPVVRNGP